MAYRGSQIVEIFKFQMHLMTLIWPILTYFFLENILMSNVYHWCKVGVSKNSNALFLLFSHFLPQNQGTKNPGDMSHRHRVDNAPPCYHDKIWLIIHKSVAYREPQIVEIFKIQMHLMTPIWPILTYFLLESISDIKDNICCKNDVSR